MEQLTLGDIIVDVVLKDIRNVHLSVYPPTGRVRIAAPLRMNLDAIRIYALSKMVWIRQQQRKFREQPREAPRKYLSKEGHYFLGKRYLLRIIEHEAPPAIVLRQSTIDMYIRPGTDAQRRQHLMEQWYREQLTELIPPLIQQWETRMSVSLDAFQIKKMKTKWGTCNRDSRRIWLNLELAKKPIHCIEYIIVHELVHLLERNHTDRFVAYMDHFLPEWRQRRMELNALPVSHWDWEY
jgi:predicted metal-dependent hydrolase